MLASGSLLFQVVLTGTPTLAYTAVLNTEITLILNTGAYQVYHDDDGTSTFDAAHQVLDETVKWSAFSPSAGIMIAKGGQIAVSGTGTLSVYGLVANAR